VGTRNFKKLLQNSWNERRFVCVGLDSSAGKLPVRHLGLRNVEEMLQAQDHFLHILAAKPGEQVQPLAEWEERVLADALKIFNRRIVESTMDILGAYKPNSAFYEALGSAGVAALIATIKDIHMRAPWMPVILDFKRGDIDNTNTGYVMAAALADAFTVHPYLGHKAMKPFLDQKDKGVFVLARTSNEGAGELQDLEVAGDTEGGYAPMPLYQRVAAHVASPGLWNYNGNCGVVAGATYPEELEEVRRIVGDDIPILAPGIGSQGGNQEATVRAAVNTCGDGFLLNDSRKAIFASSEADFPEACRARVIELNKVNDAVLATA
jgi:orotidine-5'-phosphate decarboxylase